MTESPQNGGDLFRYRIVDVGDPALDQWELIGPGLIGPVFKGIPARARAHTTPCVRFICAPRTSGASYGIVMWNVATPGPANTAIEFALPDGGGQFVLSSLHGMDFDPRRSVFVLWNGDGRVWHLKPPASGPAFTATGWTVAEAPVSGTSSPALTGGTGVLGKWKYLRSHDVMLGLGDGVEGQVWIYKPVGWQPP